MLPVYIVSSLFSDKDELHKLFHTAGLKYKQGHAVWTGQEWKLKNPFVLRPSHHNVMQNFLICFRIVMNAVISSCLQSVPSSSVGGSFAFFVVKAQSVTQTCLGYIVCNCVHIWSNVVLLNVLRVLKQLGLRRGACGERQNASLTKKHDARILLATVWIQIQALPSWENLIQGSNWVFRLACVQSANIEGEGVYDLWHTAAGGTTEILWLHFWEALLLSIFMYSQCFRPSWEPPEWHP